MGRIRWMGMGLLAVAFAAAPLSAGARDNNARQRGPKAAQIDEISGTATVIDHRSGEAIALTPGDRIRPGEQLVVGDDSMIVVRLHDGSLLEAGGGCSVTLRKEMAGAWLKLHEGRMTLSADAKRQPRVDLAEDRATLAGTSIVAFSLVPDGERLVEVITGAAGIVTPTAAGNLPDATITMYLARLDTSSQSALMRMSGEIQHSTFPMALNGEPFEFTHLITGGWARSPAPGESWSGGSVFAEPITIGDGLPVVLLGTSAEYRGWDKLSWHRDRCSEEIGSARYDCITYWYRCIGEMAGLGSHCEDPADWKNERYIYGPPYDYSGQGSDEDDDDDEDEDSTGSDDDDGAKDPLRAGVTAPPVNDGPGFPGTRDLQQTLMDVNSSQHPLNRGFIDTSRIPQNRPRLWSPAVGELIYDEGQGVYYLHTQATSSESGSSSRATRATRNSSGSSDSSRSSGSSSSSSSSGSSRSSGKSSSSSSSSSSRSSGSSSGSSKGSSSKSSSGSSSGGSSGGKSKSKSK